MKKLSETELFLLKVNACYEPELNVEGTKKAIQIIEEQKQKIDKAIEYIKNKQEDINNGGNDMSYRQLTHLLEILGDKENE